MKYQLLEDYFETPLFQVTVQDYFDTVLASIIKENASLPAKGLFFANGELKRDYYDMPYHVHILNGLIPTLAVYEQFIQQRGFEADPKAEEYLKVFMLGFTFHDANKLLGTQKERYKSELEVAVSNLNKYVTKWKVDDFFPGFEQYKSNVYYLALATENGSWVTAEDYPITLNNQEEVRTVQRELCHFADGLASIQDESLESIEGLYKAVNQKIKQLVKTEALPVSYLKVRPNPYTLLSQNLLQVARQTLTKNGKKVLYATREGFVFWGEEVPSQEYDEINKAFLTGSEEDIKFLELTKIDPQKCKFGFIGSAPFTKKALAEITSKLGDKFLLLSPNSAVRIKDFEGFVVFTKKIIETYALPIECDDKDGKLVLRYHQDLEDDEWGDNFRTIFNLHKIQWLNANTNKGWQEDFDHWQSSSLELDTPVQLGEVAGGVEITSIPTMLAFIKERVNSSNAMYKTYLNFIKTYTVLEEEDIEDYIETLQKSIIGHFESRSVGSNVKQVLFDRYFECPGHANLGFLKQYDPAVPLKKNMCAFTGGEGDVEYTAAVAFAMKARGFSNRTVTTLNNNTSHVSALFAEENKLRASLFKIADANLVVYHDFFEARLEVDRDIIQSCVQAKDEIKLLEDGTVEFDKNASFHYNLYHLTFVKLPPKVEPTFFLVRKCLRMVVQLGIRTYISGIMSPYTPHKAVFHFENAPKFLKLLGWDRVRLIHVVEVLDEMRLVLVFGKDRIESNLLKLARSRQAYFTLYYMLNKKDQEKVYNSLVSFYKKYKQKFKGMTVTEKLVELAIKVDIGFRSSAEETWLIRTAMDFLRKYHKQGNSRDDIIQKTCGEIFRKLRMKRYDMEAIKAFAVAIYDDLFQQDWQGKIPTVNVEKDWIYQFAFLFRERSLLVTRIPRAREIKNTLEKDGKEISEENVKALLPKESKRYALQYLETIQKLGTNEL